MQPFRTGTPPGVRAARAKKGALLAIKRARTVKNPFGRPKGPRGKRRKLRERTPQADFSDTLPLEKGSVSGSVIRHEDLQILVDGLDSEGGIALFKLRVELIEPVDHRRGGLVHQGRGL